MQYIKGMQLPSSLHQGIATLGNFDGVHIGHQIMLQTLVSKAKSLHVPSIVVVFEPQAQEFFQTDKPTRLMTLREKAQSIAAQGVDALVILPFNAALAGLAPQAFIQSFLKDALKPQHLIIGHDFCFGAQRAGNIETLREAGLPVTELSPVLIEGQRVSSTAIKEALVSHDLLKAEKYLGRRYQMQGRVRRGDGRGRELGFPTANIDPRRKPALRGVYAVSVKRIDGTIHPGVANLGTRPTVGGLQTLLEVHLLDGEYDLYGERLTVAFMHYIRGEQKFASLEALREQIAADASVARQLLMIGAPHEAPK